MRWLVKGDKVTPVNLSGIRFLSAIQPGSLGLVRWYRERTAPREAPARRGQDSDDAARGAAPTER